MKDVRSMSIAKYSSSLHYRLQINSPCSPRVEVFVLLCKVSMGLFPDRLVLVPKEGALMVVVPNPDGLLTTSFCEHRKFTTIKLPLTVVYMENGC